MSGQEPYQYNEDPPPSDMEHFDMEPPVQPFKDNKSQNSLDNNFDARSDKNDDLNNLMGENFEKNPQQILSEINLLSDQNAVTPKRQEELFIDAQAALTERGSKSEEVLEEMISRFDILSNQKMVRLVGLVMAVRGNIMFESEFMAQAIVFLKEAWTRLSKIDNVSRYASLIGQILKPAHPFYSIPFSEESLQVLELYLADTGEQIIDIDAQDNIFANLNPHPYRFNSELLSTLECMISQHLDDLGQVHPVQIPSQMYIYIYRNFFQSAFRKNPNQILTNVLLLARAPDIQTRHAYMEANEQGLFIQDFSIIDKQKIEEYTISLAEVAIYNANYAQKYLFRPVEWLLGENSQMEKRISGFRVLSQLVIAGRARTDFGKWLAQWLTENHVLETFLRESTNGRILQQLSPVLHFLYEHGTLESAYLVELMKSSLHSQDLFKVVQGMLSWLRVEHLDDAYDMLTHLKDGDREPMLSQFLNALVSSLTLLGNNHKRKNIMIQDNRRDVEGEIDQEVDDLSERAEGLVKKLMKLLAEKAMNDQQFMAILMRHISSHMKLLKPQLQKEIITFLKNNSPVGVWILEQCLKAETSQEQGQGKYELIGRLASEGVYEYILALTARHRFSRIVVEKCLSVVILFCRFHKPLQRNATEYLWRMLGLTAFDERQRQQFFVFLKDIVRYEGAVSEQSVNFIFFELLMGLSADWFSLRVYDCLEMLFLRLNQDCKLISFEKDHYKIIQPPLIGADKLWYIYFNCPDLKVTKKCKDFIFKLIMSSSDKKQQLYQDSLVNIKKYLQAAVELPPQLENKQQVLILRGFQISEKLLLERQRIQDTTKSTLINVKIIDTTPNSFEKTKNLEFNENISLSDIKTYIAQVLNPQRRPTEIQLLNKGKILVGENQTLKEMKLQNNQTITVSLVNTEIQPLSQLQKQQKKREQQQKLYELFGNQFPPDLVSYIVQKFQGETIENIANVMFDQTRIEQIREEFDRYKQDVEEEMHIQQMQLRMQSEKKEEPKKFGEMLVETITNVQLLLRCLTVSNNKKGGWKFLKELPINKEYFKVVEDHIKTGDWAALFKNGTQEQSKYIAYILTHIIRQSSSQSDAIFNEKQLRDFLIQWILQVVDTSTENLEDYENIFKLLLASLSCPMFAEVETFTTSKKGVDEECSLSKKLPNMMEIETMPPANINLQICCKLLDALFASNFSQKMTLTIVKIYLYQLYYHYHQQAAYSIIFQRQLHMLILRYGKPIYFTIVATVMKLQNQSILKSFNISKFTLNLLHDLVITRVEEKQSHYHYAAFFSCIDELLFMTPVQDPTEELNALSIVLAHIKNNISSLRQEEIIGYMRISLKLLNRHLTTEHGQRRNDELREFAHWLFSNYLFGIHASLPYFKNKPVRKFSYHLILGLCSYQLINKNIVSSVKKLMNNCKGLEKEEGEFRTSEFIGMKNLGATCYINSLIQQLYHTVFPKLLLQDDGEDSEGQIKLLQLKKLFVNLYIGVKSPVSTNKYVQTVKINGDHIRPHVQQDVNQYFASLMHEIQQSVGNKAINSTMSGTLCHEIRGLQEGSEVKNVEETYLTLMIQMRGKKNLNEALSALTKQHILEGDNMYYSDFLHRLIRASSRTYLDKLPPLLVITLKRFNWIYQTMTRQKINDYFQFPIELDLSKYAIPGKKEADHYYEYKLSGILIHSGSAESGHYYSFIKVGERWLEFNDRRVSEWDIQNNLKNQCFGGNEERNRNAYMLFYERVDSQVHGACLSMLSDKNRMIKQIKNENESFIKNRLIYDSGYIDFIKELAKIQGNSSLLEILEGLNLNRNYYEYSNTHIDVDNFLGGGGNEKKQAHSEKGKDKPELNRKLDEIDRYLENNSRNNAGTLTEQMIVENDETMPLLTPNEKGTQNDKL